MAVQTADAVVQSCLHVSLKQLRKHQVGWDQASFLMWADSLRLKMADEGLMLLPGLGCGFPRDQLTLARPLVTCFPDFLMCVLTSKSCPSWLSEVSN